MQNREAKKTIGPEANSFARIEVTILVFDLRGTDSSSGLLDVAIGERISGLCMRWSRFCVSHSAEFGEASAVTLIHNTQLLSVL
jgi:hypothetical protein